MVKYEEDVVDIDRVLFALSSATRRGMTEIMLREGPKPMSALAIPFDISLPGAKKHIGILEEAGIVTCRKQGRENICAANAEALAAAARWFEFHERFWNASLDRLGRLLEGRHE